MSDPADTRPRGTPVGPSDPSPAGRDEDINQVSRQIELLIRQRHLILDRLQEKTPLPPPGPDESLVQRIKELEQENRTLVARLQASQTPPPVPAPSPSDPFLEREAARLREENALLRRAAAEQNEVLRLAQNKMSERDQEITRVKVSLSDAIIEEKRIREELAEQRRQVASLAQDLQARQAQLLDLGLRLENSQHRERALEDEIKRLSEAVRTTGHHTEEAREGHLAAESRAHALQLEVQRLSEDLATTRVTAKQAADEVIRLHRVQELFDAAERRERDLIDTLDRIQKDRDQLHDRLGRMLTGVKEYIAGPVRLPPGSSDGPMDPRTLAPYLPFCWPERLPAALSLRWRSTFRQEPAAAPPTPGFEAPPEPCRTFDRFHLYQAGPQPTLPCHRGVFPLRDPEPAPFRVTPESQSLVPLATAPQFRMPPERLLVEEGGRFRRYPLVNPQRPLPKRLFQPEARLPIFHVSFDLFLTFLDNSIRHRKFTRFTNLALTMPPEPSRSSREEGSTDSLLPDPICAERLAALTHSPLQLPLQPFRREPFRAAFQHGRLHTLLKSFQDSLDSMVEKYQLSEPPSSPNPAGPPPTGAPRKTT